jgi:hypothetical protein
MSTAPPANRTSGKPLWRVSAIALLAAATPVAYFVYLAYLVSDPDHHWANEYFEHELAAVKSGAGNSLHLYDTRKTDALLRRVEGLAEVERLCLEQTDVSEAGLASVATLPRLRSLGIYQWRGITDQGLANLRGLSSLEELHLRIWGVTNEGLRVLEDLPGLRTLGINWGPQPGVLDDAGLAHLKQLSELETLWLAGGWASAKTGAHLKQLPKLRTLWLIGDFASLEAVAELQAQLPNCTIRTPETCKSSTGK